MIHHVTFVVSSHRRSIGGGHITAEHHEGLVHSYHREPAAYTYREAMGLQGNQASIAAREEQTTYAGSW